jgi:transcriptional regulator GlxA family with amidase domain
MEDLPIRRTGIFDTPVRVVTGHSFGDCAMPNSAPSIRRRRGIRTWRAVARDIQRHEVATTKGSRCLQHIPTNSALWRTSPSAMAGCVARRAIAWIKDHYAAPLPVHNRAKRVRMRTWALRAHFSAVADVSPIQYQSRLRLQEARRLMQPPRHYTETMRVDVAAEGACSSQAAVSTRHG